MQDCRRPSDLNRPKIEEVWTGDDISRGYVVDETSQDRQLSCVIYVEACAWYEAEPASVAAAARGFTKTL